MDIKIILLKHDCYQIMKFQGMFQYLVAIHKMYVHVYNIIYVYIIINNTIMCAYQRKSKTSENHEQ